jgi:hypothetical protein
MLVLPILTRGDLIVIEDDAARDRVHVALARPRVARRPDGSSRVRLVRWTTTSGGTTATAVGGRLTLDVDLQPTPAELAAAGLTARETLPMPWLDAKVRLEGPQFDPVEAEVSRVAGTAAAVSVDLTPEAASVLAPLLQPAMVSPLQITWLGHVLVRLPAVEVIATADVTEIRRRIDLVNAGRHVTITRSIIDANARIEIRGTDNATLEKALRDWVLDELASRLAAGRSLNVRAAASEVVHWPIHLATTLDDFAPPSSRGSFVETVILDTAEIGRVPPIEVRVLADFSGPLERVDVRLNPAATDRVVELAFTDDMPRSASLGTADYRWCHRVKMDGRPSGDWSPWQEVRGSSAVILPIATPARLNVEVLAAGLNFTDRWASVRVVLTHTAPGSAPISQTIELNKTRTSATWTAPLDGVRGSLKAQLTYVSRQGQTIDRVMDDIAADQVVVLDPLDGNRVRFTLVPAGTGWNDMALAMVDLRYADGAYVVEEAIELRKLDDFADWEVPARAEGPRVAQWRLHTSFADGRFQSGEWQTAPAGVIVVRVDGVRRRNVQLLPIYFDSIVTKNGTIRLRSGSQTETVVISDRSERSVTLGPGPFSWTIQWTAANGTQLAESGPHEGEDIIVVPRFQPG